MSNVLNDLSHCTEFEDLKPYKRELKVFLDTVRDSGVCNMAGASPYLEEHFKLNRRLARQAVWEWIDNHRKEAELIKELVGE